MGLNHKFLLVDREIDGEWELTRFVHDPRWTLMHDDLVRYMLDTLAWIPTFNPSRRERMSGLCMWGPTIIDEQGAAIAARVFQSWADLFAAGPSAPILTGGYTWIVDQDLPGPGTGTLSEPVGRYEKFSIDRDEVVGVLHRLAHCSMQVQSAAGRLYLLHHGV